MQYSWEILQGSCKIWQENASFLHVLVRFLELNDLSQNSCENLARNVFPERILQEMYCLEGSCEKSIKLKIILQDSSKKHVFGRILLDSRMNCIFAQLGKLQSITRSNCSMDTYSETVLVNYYMFQTKLDLTNHGMSFNPAHTFIKPIFFGGYLPRQFYYKNFKKLCSTCSNAGRNLKTWLTKT